MRARFEHWLERQWQHRGVWAWTMAPLALIFGLLLKLRKHLIPIQTDRDRFSVPLVVVGNIYIGGTGKTPVVIALVKQLRELGWQPGVISRGYGTRIGEHPIVGQGHLDADRYGDEPALIARESGAPVSVHPNRSQAYFYLLEHFPQVDVVISDDGLQHLRLYRDIEIIVQDNRGAGNGWLLPAGPLREPVSRLKTAQAHILRIDGDTPLAIKKQSALLAGGQLSSGLARHTKASLGIERFRNLVTGQVLETQQFLTLTKEQKVTAIAGIANPSRFFLTLEKLGLTLTHSKALADHFVFSPSFFNDLDTDIVLMTAKDAVKCENTADQRLWVAEAEMRFSDPEFISWLDHQLQAKSVRTSSD